MDGLRLRFGAGEAVSTKTVEGVEAVSMTGNAEGKERLGKSGRGGIWSFGGS